MAKISRKKMRNQSNCTNKIKWPTNKMRKTIKKQARKWGKLKEEIRQKI